MTRRLVGLVVMAATFAAGAARAQEGPTSEDPSSDVGASSEATAPRFEVSLKAGGHFPQLANDLKTNFDAILKFGVGVALERRLQIFFEMGYTQPTHDAGTDDPRLGTAGAAYSTTMTVRDLSLTLGAQYFIRPPSSHWLPYAGLGLQARMLRSEVVGTSGGASFGQNNETSTQLGGTVYGGVALHLGPGLAYGELRFGFAPVAQKVTGEANVGAMSALLGYGLFF